MSVSFNGIGEMYATFLSENTEAGVPVAVSGNKTVAKAASGAVFCGVAVSVKDAMNAVQIAGYVKLPYTGTAPAAGYAKLTANGSGGVTANSSGREYLIIEVDSTEKTIGFFI